MPINIYIYIYIYNVTHIYIYTHTRVDWTEQQPSDSILAYMPLSIHVFWDKNGLRIYR